MAILNQVLWDDVTCLKDADDILWLETWARASNDQQIMRLETPTTCSEWVTTTGGWQQIRLRIPEGLETVRAHFEPQGVMGNN